MKVFKNAALFDFESFTSRGYVRFESEIVDLGEMSEYEESPGDEVYDLGGKLIMPGFVNGHTHIYSTFARGMIVPFDPKSFVDILKQLWWKLDSKLDLEAVRYSGLVSAVEFAKNGVTTVIDHHASGMAIRGTLKTLKEAVVDVGGLRGIFCFETSDRFDVEEAVRENLDFLEDRSEKHAGMFGMHASLSLSDETLRLISSVLDGHPIHVHVAESEEDELDSLERYGLRVVERFERYGLLNDGSILAHCVHVDEGEIEIMANHGIRVAVNPTSNMNNAVGLPKVKDFVERGIKVVIGNDGLGYNVTRDWMNLYFSQKLKYSSPTAFDLVDLKQLISNTYELASELLGVKLGRLERGYKADMVVLDYTPPTPMNPENAMGHVFFGVFDKPEVVHVLVDGEFVVKDKESVLDVQSIYSEARRVAEKVWERLDE